MNPSSRIREIADSAPTEEVKNRLLGLAAEFETQHNNQNNQWAIVFGQLQNKVEEMFAAMRFDMNQAFGDQEVRQNKLLEMMERLQQDMRDQQARDAE